MVANIVIWILVRRAKIAASCSGCCVVVRAATTQPGVVAYSDGSYNDNLRRLRFSAGVDPDLRKECKVLPATPLVSKALSGPVHRRC